MSGIKRVGAIDARDRRILEGIIHETDGFAVTLTIIALPFFLAIAAWVIDASRVGNLHTDLQNAVDAMALAGARELDGRDDAIPRAQNAIAGLSNRNVALFAGGGVGMSMGSRMNMNYDPADAAASTVEVKFLKSLPASDDEPINLAVHEVSGNATEQSNEARYAYVIAKNQSLQTIFPLAMAGRQSVQVNAEAVATYRASACDVTPIYVCNPFETGGPSGNDNTDFHENFKNGNLYARQMVLRFDSSSPPGPGNFGFLRTFGNGANVLAHALATGSPGQCFEEDGLDTEPGQNVGPVKNGLNTRMGIYGGSFNGYKNDPLYRPDMNVRKGQKQPPDCAKYDPEDNPLNAMPFPEGNTVFPNGGGTISSPDWNLDLYWDITHGGHTTPPLPADDPAYDPDSPPLAPGDVYSYKPNLPPTAMSLPPNPSRYDVYLYELMHQDVAPAPASLVNSIAPNTETGAPTCQGPAAVPDLEDRRVVFAAVVDCIANAPINGQTNIPAVAFARMFMSRPVETDGNVRSIFLEVVDITGSGGLGTVEEKLREEAELVR